MQLHIGREIRRIAKQKQVKQIELAEMINTSKQNIYSIYQRKTIETGILVKICNALDHNFFTYNLGQLDFDAEKEAKEEMNALKQSLIEKTKEIEYLKEIINLQKEILGKKD
jgi:DNA-binding Xre family transcriptional regulator